MDTASSHNARPATGFRRQANRAVLQALRILPSPLRRRLGWWRWEEVIGVEYTEAMGVEMVFDRPPSPAIDPSFTSSERESPFLQVGDESEGCF